MFMDTEKNLKMKFPVTDREISGKLCVVFKGVAENNKLW